MFGNLFLKLNQMVENITIIFDAFFGQTMPTIPLYALFQPIAAPPWGRSVVSVDDFCEDVEPCSITRVGGLRILRNPFTKSAVYQRRTPRISHIEAKVAIPQR